MPTQDHELRDSKDGVVKTVCSICHCCCGVLAHVQKGKVVKVEGDPEHPNNRGSLCVKGLSGIELLYHPDRLNFPLKRIGRRGEGNWERISWDEALETIAEKLAKIKNTEGPEAICITRGGGMYGNVGIVGYFGYLLGTPNVMASSFICFQPHVAAVRATIGYSEAIHATEVVFDELMNSKCILLWAANPKEAAPYPVGEGIAQSQKNGTKLIVVDPRPTDHAKAADIWLQIKPATDDALALGMIHVIINEELYDKAFVEQWTYGFEHLKKHVQEYPPQKVSQMTWVASEDIVAAARTFAGIKPSSICQRVPVDQNCNAVQTSRAILILNAICGNLDKKGGNLLPATIPGRSESEIFQCVNKLPLAVLEKRLGGKEFPLLSGATAPPANVHPTLWTNAVLTGKPYPVRALITSARNWIMGDQNTRVIESALRKLEFSVTVDLFMTPTAELSDIVLPAVSWLEREGLRGHPGYPYVIPIQHAATPPLFERRDDIKFFIELAKKMELRIPWNDVIEYMNFRLEGTGHSFEALEGRNFVSRQKEYERYKKGNFEFKTNSGKVELYSNLLVNLGYDPLPRPQQPPATTTSFPLILMGGKKRVEYLHSAGRQIGMLRQRVPEPIVELNPETAKQKGIFEGDWVWIETIYFGEKERVRFRAKLIEGFHPLLVSVDHAWWFPERRDAEHGCFESNINRVIPADVYDPLFGCSNLRSIPCRIYREEIVKTN
jgi:anaerobic selenocysteine-containing dehydrogenase